ncbi:2-oxoglutarate dehydrogenase complex dihydrolipoyllysine-residue succinyltransferase [Chlamydiifrater volucris]|uniref:2-oxoglutarate dehydrogenase complex dihydrolipoyllysine-residue succinyltransferase n=1 Tax=Chlamydiifrater volucris TaxID=2681470 RepID=UPI001BCFBD23|nr:2-oxoglutarate dehydrogenase complex dihydrolipoyllysine-residue succinyltransferase [Chlamydiifrater volucris]
MVIEIKIPDIAESISEVTIAALLVSEGSFVQENQGILEIESDKLNQQIYSPSSGRISWEVSQGDVVAVGAIVGKLYSEGEAGSPSQQQTHITESVTSSEVSSERGFSDKEVDLSLTASSPGDFREGSDKVIPFNSDVSDQKSVKIQDLPPQRGNFIPLKNLSQDTEDLAEERTRMSGIRKTISKRLVQALQESAMLTTFNEIDMTALILLRKEKQEEFVAKHGIKLGFMSFFIKAVVAALKEVPQLNAYIDEDYIVYRKYFDISVAVGTDRGLVVPVIKNCDSLTNADIEKTLANLATRAREGGLSLDDLKGGCFTITNGGVYGSLLSTPIINPPQVGILGMHKIEKRPVVIDNEVAIREMMYVALSYDHRIIDGKEAVTFLVKVKELLEMPEVLLD